MYWIVDTFGGRLHTYTASQTPKNSRRTVYRWIATGERVSHLCELILPYVQAKVRQIQITEDAMSLPNAGQRNEKSS